MGFFSMQSQFDTDVEKATSETNVSEEWGHIMEVVDKVGTTNPTNAKDCLRSIVKRLNNPDPHIVIHAITLLDTCASNCGKIFHLEIASRDFESELKKLINHPEPKIAEKSRAVLKKWAEGDFKSDSRLNLIPTLYNKLKKDGMDFSSTSETPKHTVVLSKDPNVVTNSQEEEDIAKAIELSLKESQQQQHPTTSHGSPASKKSTSLYPNMTAALSSATTSATGRKVRALYDFEAAEDNELTFQAGEIVQIIDDSDPNWWKGSNHRGEGLFPSNFVSADLTVEPDQFTKLEHSSKKSVQFSDEVEVKTVKRELEVVEVEIDEKKMDRLLHLLHEADPQSDETHPKEMLDLEEQVMAMGPLIDAALEKVDGRHAQLTKLSADLVDAVNMYHSVMPQTPPMSTMMSTNYPLPKVPHHMNLYQYTHPGSLPPLMFNGMQPPPGMQHPPQSFNPAGGPSHTPVPHPGHFTTNMMPNEYMGVTNSISIGALPPQHFHMQTGPVHPAGRLQGPQGPEPSSLPFQPQPNFQVPNAHGPRSYVPEGAAPNQPVVDQQSQFPPPNGQRMM